MTIYIIGIMLYKFGLEGFNGSIIALAANKFDYQAYVNNTPSNTFERIGLLTGLNQAFRLVATFTRRSAMSPACSTRYSWPSSWSRPSYPVAPCH